MGVSDLSKHHAYSVGWLHTFMVCKKKNFFFFKQLMVFMAKIVLFEEKNMPVKFQPD